MRSAASDISVLISIGLVQLLALISPGPDFLITARTAVARSRLDGVKVALGLATGTVVWASAALLGLNVIFHAVPILFLGMKIIGALFLVWIAWQIFRHAAIPIAIGTVESDVPGNLFIQGFLTKISNPKAVVFYGSIFLAMLPADVPLWMTLSLVAIVVFNNIWWYSAVALFFGSGPVRRFYIKAKVWIDRVTGLFLGALGIRLLWAARETA